MNNADILDQIANGVFEANEAERNALAAGAAALRVDPADIAYLGMGAIQALDEGGKQNGSIISRMGYGQIEFITGMLALCQPAVQKVWEECSENYGGVYAYDVCEPLGMWFVRETVRLRKMPTAMACLATARKYAE